jgi:hypothetical protein
LGEDKVGNEVVIFRFRPVGLPSHPRDRGPA